MQKVRTHGSPAHAPIGNTSCGIRRIHLVAIKPAVLLFPRQVISRIEVGMQLYPRIVRSRSYTIYPNLTVGPLRHNGLFQRKPYRNLFAGLESLQRAAVTECLRCLEIILPTAGRHTQQHTVTVAVGCCLLRVNHGFEAAVIILRRNDPPELSIRNFSLSGQQVHDSVDTASPDNSIRRRCIAWPKVNCPI